MIRTAYYYQDNEPLIIDRDSRGTFIAPGLRVAYNHSGNVVAGTIFEVKKNIWENLRNEWRLKFEIHIMGENGKLSKIKNPNSFVII
jgi:hypothetical protein